MPNDDFVVFPTKDLQGSAVEAADDLPEYIRWHIGEEPPKILYKYREFSNPYHRSLLEKGEIYFSSFGELNDEKEGRIPLVYTDIQNEPLLKASQTRKFLDESKYGIFSLSKSSSISTMWEFYSESKKGFCVGFYTPNLIGSVFGGDLTLQEAYQHLLPVRYFSREKRHIMSESAAIENDFLTIQKIAGTKIDDWEREQEIRLIGKNMASQVVTVPDSVISHVLLGKEMNNENKKAILSILQGRNIRVFEILDNLESDKDFLHELNKA